MRTTIDLPESLVKKAIAVTHVKKKTNVIILALEELIRKYKISHFKKFKGKIDLDMKLDVLRDR